MNLCQQMSFSDRSSLGEAWEAWPWGRTALEGASCSAGHFTFSMWVKKILIFHTPQIPKAKYLLSALPFPSQAEVVAMPGSWGGRGKPLQGGALGIAPQLPPKLCSRSPVCYGRSQAGFLETGRKTQESCLKASVGRNRAPCGEALG